MHFNGDIKKREKGSYNFTPYVNNNDMNVLNLSNVESSS
jgi:hypothetical protein